MPCLLMGWGHTESRRRVPAGIPFRQTRCFYPQPPCPVYVQSLSRVQLFATPWTAACQAPLSMGFSRPEYWSGLPFPSPGDLSNPGVEPGSPALQVDSLPDEPPGKPTPLSPYPDAFDDLKSPAVRMGA